MVASAVTSRWASFVRMLSGNDGFTTSWSVTKCTFFAAHVGISCAILLVLMSVEHSCDAGRSPCDDVFRLLSAAH